MTAPAPRRPPTRPRPASARSSSLVYGAVVLVGLGFGAGTFLAATAPADIIRSELAAAVRAETGRDLIVAGRTSFSFFPAPGLTLRDVILAAPAGMSGPPTATVPEIAVSVRLWPLLRQRVEMTRIALRKPILDLRIDAEGRRSWDQAARPAPGLLRSASGQPFRVADAGTTRTDAAPGTGTGTGPDTGPNATTRRLRKALHRVHVAELAIEGATVRFTDERRGTSRQLEAVETRVDFDPAGGPARLRGTLLAAGEPVSFEASLGSLDGLIRQKPETLAVSLTSGPLSARLDGSIHVRPELALAGRVEAKSPSARNLARWLGTTLPPSRGFGALAFAGDLSVDGPRSSLANATVTMDGITARGDIATDVSGPRPRVAATLDIPALDLDTYAALAPEAPLPEPPATEAPASVGGAPGGGPRVKGFSRRAGWSEQPIDTTLLGLVDGEARLRLGGLKLRDIKLGRSSATLTLAARRLTWRLDDAEVYGGTVKGSVVTDAASRPVRLSIDLAADGVAALPLLKDAAGFDWIAGKGKVRLALESRGDSERDIVSALAGTADFDFADGAIVGFNVAKIVRGLSRGQLADFERVPTERTDFSEMAARFVVRNGVASNDDLRLVSPLIRVGGSGRVTLTDRTIDYTLKPRLVASLLGQGAKEKPAEAPKGIEVPIRVTGAWEAPSIHADVAGLLKDPDKAVDAVREIGRTLGGKKTGDFLDKLFGKK